MKYEALSVARPAVLKTMLKSVAKRLPHPLLMRLYHSYYLRGQATLACDLARVARLPMLDELHLNTLRTSDTVFILGSGWSINEIPNERWEIIGRHDTIGFNFWPVHSFVPGIFVFENLCTGVQRDLYKAFRGLIESRANDYRRTVKIVTEPYPQSQRQLLHELPEGFCENLYVGYTASVVARDERELATGIRYLESLGMFTPANHIRWLFKYGGSAIAMLSLAVRMNYRRIVLCGIDLGRQEYFYQCRQRYPDTADWEFTPRKDMHLTTRRLPWMVPAQQVIYQFKRLVLDPAGIGLFVENRSSTLYPVVPEASQHLFEQLAVSPNRID
jgi:hypothetical protein